MARKKRVILSIIVFIVLLVAAYAGYRALSGGTPSDSLKQQEGISSGGSQKIKAEDFSMTDQHGNQVKLSDMKGKPIVLNFWASWCPPCKEEMPTFDKLSTELKGKVEFMMVDLVDGQKENSSDGKAYIDQKGFKFPVYFDAKQEGANTYQVYSIPTTLFIDKDGYLVHRTEGAIDEVMLRDAIEKIQ